jgi:hypothetical protein
MISSSVAHAYYCVLWLFVIALVGYGAVLAIMAMYKSSKSLRGSHSSQFQDGMTRRR